MSYGVAKAVQVAVGQAISARNTDQYRRAIEAVQAASNAIKSSGPRSWAETMLHVITADGGDYLECSRVWRDPDIGTKTVFVAKPALLRPSVTDRDGVTYTYTDSQTRTATQAATTEVQRVTPNYLVGDFIEVQVIRGRTGVPEVDAQRGSPIDTNVDGRAWAFDPEATPPEPPP